MKVKNNKMLFNSRNWFKFASSIFNSVFIRQKRLSSILEL